MIVSVATALLGLVDDAAVRVAADSAVGNRQCRAAAVAVVEDAAAGSFADRVPADSAVGNRQRRVVVEGVVEDTAASGVGVIAAERAVGDRHRAVFVTNATPGQAKLPLSMQLVTVTAPASLKCRRLGIRWSSCR